MIKPEVVGRLAGAMADRGPVPRICMESFDFEACGLKIHAGVWCQSWVDEETRLGEVVCAMSYKTAKGKKITQFCELACPMAYDGEADFFSVFRGRHKRAVRLDQSARSKDLAEKYQAAFWRAVGIAVADAQEMQRQSNEQKSAEILASIRLMNPELIYCPDRSLP